MKRIVLSVCIAIIGILVFGSCSSDDDNDGPVCENCALEVLGVEIVTEYCDNGDGTVTATFEEQEITQSLEGLTFEEFINTLEQAGAACNRI